jgi:TPR repeat protein
MELTRVSLIFESCRRARPSRRRLAGFGLAVAVAIAALDVSDAPALAQQQRGFAKTAQPAPADTRNGNYYALIIGINTYPTGMARLKTAVNDANAVGQLLEERYGFQVQYLRDGDATRFKILNAITKLRSTLSENDNLLIYYGGHGYFDKDADKGYWLPVDAESATSPNAIMADDLTSAIRALPSRHVLIVSDSCYSGDLSRDASEPPPPTVPTPNYLRKQLQAKSRSLMASGGDEPVSDSGANGHSVFANAVIKALEKEGNPVFSAEELFYDSVRRQVAGNSDQIPKYTHIRNSGDDDGDFIFTRKGAKISAAAAGETTNTLTRSATTETASTEPAPAPAADIPLQRATSASNATITPGEAFDQGFKDLQNSQFTDALRLLAVACDGGVAKGCGNLGWLYQNSKGVSTDLARAAVFYRQGCAGDGWGACFFLGVMLENGNGVPRDQAQAVALYRRACDGSDGRGCTNLGFDLGSGNGVAKDVAQAASVLRKGCDSGVPRGCSLLGLAYHEGGGVAKDESQAAQLTRKGCEGGDPMGCNLLGVGYEFGFGVPVNKQQAVTLYRQSCAAGFDPGCKNLNRVQR